MQETKFPCQSWHGLDLKDNLAEEYRLQEATGHEVIGSYVVYAAQKAHMFQEMWQTAEKAFITCGGGWPATKEELSKFVAAHQPWITIDWNAQHIAKDWVNLDDLEKVAHDDLDDKTVDDNDNVLTVELEQ